MNASFIKFQQVFPWDFFDFFNEQKGGCLKLSKIGNIGLGVVKVYKMKGI